MQFDCNQGGTGENDERAISSRAYCGAAVREHSTYLESGACPCAPYRLEGGLQMYNSLHCDLHNDAALDIGS